jgi:hypothetical protein
MDNLHLVPGQLESVAKNFEIVGLGLFPSDTIRKILPEAGLFLSRLKE